MKKEIWKDVVDYEGRYEVSNIGRVKSVDRKIYKRDGTIQPLKGRVMKQRLNRNRYYIVDLSKDGNTTTFETHVLVAGAFLGYKPERGNGIVCDHRDNDRQNNNAENLQIITCRQNSVKDLKVGTSRFVGVFWCNTYNKWASRIRHNGKQIHIGYYKCELKAAKAYQDKLEKINNEF